MQRPSISRAGVFKSFLPAREALPDTICHLIFCIFPCLTGKIRSFGRTGTGPVPMIGKGTFRPERAEGREIFRSETCLPAGRDQGGDGSE